MRATWTVHIEAEGKDASGAPIRYVIDGKLENIGAYQRVLSGTWTEGPRRALQGREELSSGIVSGIRSGDLESGLNCSIVSEIVQ